MRINFLKYIVLGFFLLESASAAAQTYWKVENDWGDEILLTLEINKGKNSFVATSRKDALKDLAGTFMYTVAKAAGKLKYPEIVHIEGSTAQNADTLKLAGEFSYFDKQYHFKASIVKQTFQGIFLDNRNRPQQLKGVQVNSNKPIKDYNGLISSAISLTERALVQAQWVHSSEWSDFKKKVTELKEKIADDYELAATYFWLGKKLPFGVYEISKDRPHLKSSERKGRAGFRNLDSQSAYLETNSIPVNGHEMDSVAQVIKNKGFTKLVVDLRGNHRLSMEGALTLAGYITPKTTVEGVCVTRRWLDNHQPLPSLSEWGSRWKRFIDTDLQPGMFYQEAGRIMVTPPDNNPFKGKVFVLIDHRTSGPAELLVHWLKNGRLATVVGQKSSGLPYFIEHIKLSPEFDLVLADGLCYNADGKEFPGSGIEPDIAQEGQEIMKYVSSH